MEPIPRRNNEERRRVAGQLKASSVNWTSLFAEAILGSARALLLEARSSTRYQAAFELSR